MAKRPPGRPAAADDPRWTSDIAPAPGELRIVQAFLNTAPRRKHAEELPSPEALNRWLARWQLVPEGTELGAAELARAKELRDGFRGQLRTHSGAALDEQAAARLEAAAAGVPVRLRVATGGGLYLAPASAAAAALGRLVGIFAEVCFGPLWPRLKVCGDAACGAAFYDTTKNLGGRWCTQRCGNRMAARARRRRLRR